MSFSRDWYATPDKHEGLWGRGVTREQAINEMLTKWGEAIIESEAAYGDPPRFDFTTNRQEKSKKTGEYIDIDQQRHFAALILNEWRVYEANPQFKKGELSELTKKQS